MKNDFGYVRRLNKTDADAVFAVRRKHIYRQNVQGSKLSYLEWNEVDDIAIVLGVFNQNDELLASLRGEIIKPDEAESKLHYTIDSKLDIFPAYCLGVAQQKSLQKLRVQFFAALLLFGICH